MRLIHGEALEEMNNLIKEGIKETLIIGDTHFGARGDRHVFLDYQEKYFTEEFFPFVDEHEIKYIIHIGDLFDRRKHINFNTLQRVKEFFLDPMLNRGITMSIIPGNHDVAYKNTNKLNSLDLLLKEYDNVWIYHEPVVLSEFDGPDTGKKLGLVPWMNAENYDQCMQFIADTAGEVDILAGHFEMQGVEMLRGIKSEGGIPMSVFHDHNQVISGHFHTPSVNGNIWYPGSPYEFTWADYGQDKGFVVWNMETGDLTKVSTKSSMFHKIYYDDTKEFELKKIKSQFEDYRDKYVKIIISQKSNKTRFDQFLIDLYDHNPFEVSIVESDMELGLSADELNIETQSTMEIIDGTIDNMTLNVNTNELKKLFHELYSEAINIEV